VAAISAWMFVFYEALSGRYLGGILNAMAEMGIYAAVIGYVGMLVVGLPVHLWLQRRGPTSLWRYTGLGALCGASPIGAWLIYVVVVESRFGVWRSLRSNTPAVGEVALMCGFAGALVAGAFWVIAVREGHPRIDHLSEGEVV
jgi:hypothetical protein